jgi:hypothetical protein
LKPTDGVDLAAMVGRLTAIREDEYLLLTHSAVLTNDGIFSA